MREARCLGCGGRLPVKVLWDFARIDARQGRAAPGLLTRAGLLRGKIGIQCPNCGAGYRVVQTRIRIAYALTWTVLLGMAAYLEDWTGHHHMSVFQRRPLSVLIVIVLAFVMFLLLQIYAPRLALVRPARHGEQLSFPLASALEHGKL